MARRYGRERNTEVYVAVSNHRCTSLVFDNILNGWYMGVEAIFKCDGCPATVGGTHRLEQKFYGISGRRYGFGHHKVDSVCDAIPDGWIAYDLIGCTYCPSCWASICGD